MGCSEGLVHWSTMQHFQWLLSFGIYVPISFAIEDRSFSAAWKTTSAASTAVIVFSAVITFIGMWLQTWGFQNARVSEAAVMAYIEVLWATVLQKVAFHIPCHAIAGFGCFLVVLSGMVNIMSKQLSSFLGCA